MSSAEKLLALSALCLLNITAAPANARVFLRWGAGARVERTMEALGGRAVYEARITLNGGQGNLRIYAFDRDPADVGRDMDKAFQTAGLAPGEAAMSLATVRLRGVVVRFVLLDLTDGRQTLVFAMEQTEREFEQSSSPLENADIHGIPAYPGSSAIFRAEDHNTGTSFAVLESSAPAATVRGFYRSRLADEGWMAAVPGNLGDPAAPAPGAASPSLSMYLKPGRLCCLLAEEKGFPGATRITIVHKARGVE